MPRLMAWIFIFCCGHDGFCERSWTQVRRISSKKHRNGEFLQAKALGIRARATPTITSWPRGTDQLISESQEVSGTSFASCSLWTPSWRSRGVRGFWLARVVLEVWIPKDSPTAIPWSLRPFFFSFLCQEF